MAALTLRKPLRKLIRELFFRRPKSRSRFGHSMIGFMFGIWYLAVAIGMKMAGIFGETSEAIAQEKGLSHFFWLLTGIAIGLGVLSAVLYPVIKKLMHGVR